MNLLRCVVVEDDAPFIKAAQALLEAEGGQWLGQAAVLPKRSSLSVRCIPASCFSTSA